MEPYTNVTGLVAPLDRANVDTDQITPKQYLKTVKREGLGQFVFRDWRFDENDNPRPDFVLNQPRYQGATILLARRNFGCGSSREHSPWALKDFGLRTIVAPSFADIFYNNCFKNGMLPVELTEEQVDELFRRTEENEGYELTVDLAAQTVSDDRGWSVTFEIDPTRKERLLAGLDEIGLTLKKEPVIREYESKPFPGQVPAPSKEAAEV